MASAEPEVSDDRPVSDDEAIDLFAHLKARTGLALAVSGGADSVALLHLYDRARRHGTLPPAVVLSVDHRLRPAARDEIAHVARLATERGLPHLTSSWDEATLGGNLQARAARARRRLLLDSARAAACDALLLAHHADDQAETVLGRLARGSGVLGLAGMAATSEESGILVARPLLALPKSRLVATLREAGVTWCEDPSNADPRFQRARLRAARATLTTLGLDRDRLIATARAMARAGALIDRLVRELDTTAVTRSPAGWLQVELGPFVSADDEIRLRLLSRLLREPRRSDYGPRLEALEDLDAELRACSSGERLVRTLAGCRLELRRGRLWIAAEVGRRPETVTLAPAERGIWRGRPVSLAPEAPAPLTIAPLGREGRLGFTRPMRAELRHDATTPPSAILETAPALWREGRLLACLAFASALGDEGATALEHVEIG